AEVKAMSKVSPSAFSLRPALRASATPCSDRSTSRQPVNRFFRFHSLWPWRTSTRSRSVIAAAPKDCGSEITEAEHIDHGIEPGWPRPRPLRGLERTVGKDHPVLGLVGELETFRGPGEDHAVVADHGAAA